MPCSDSSSSIAIRLDHEEKFVSFDFAKITCGRPIGSLREGDRGQDGLWHVLRGENPAGNYCPSLRTGRAGINERG